MTVNSPGVLVVIEGGDGLGKSTQVKLLEDELRSAGCRVMSLDFPTKAGHPIGRIIGEYLRGEHGEVSPEFLSLAFAADRLVSASSISHHLAEGGVVLCDRYVRSNIAFQGAKIPDETRRARLGEMLEWLEYGVHRLARPDLEVVLTAPAEYYRSGEHLGRADGDPARSYLGTSADIHEGSFELQMSVNKYFGDLQESACLRKLDIYNGRGRRPRDELRQAIWSCVENVVFQKGRGGPMKMRNKIASVWSADDVGAMANEVCMSLLPTEKERLFEIYRVLSDSVGGEGGRGQAAKKVSERELVILYAFGLEGADVLLYVPAELRDARLERMANETGLPSDLVRRVAVLGSQEIAKMLDQ